MKIIFIGDVVGKPGRDAVSTLLPQVKKEQGIDFCITNIENAAGGFGITPKIIDDFLSFGVDVLTSGDHIWDRRELIEVIDSKTQLLRPANYPKGAPGAGYCVTEVQGKKVAVVNLLGRVFMHPVVDDPFKEAGALVKHIRKETPIIVVDMHAEATSEKVAMGHFLAGQVSAVIGTHTHIPTADEKILSGGTAYITDAGMTGPYDSVIGQRKDRILEKFLTGLPVRFEVAIDDVWLHAVIIDIDEQTGKARSIQRIQRGL
ncbi:TIGR00282 family metallophosphoesterase [Candidatus Omnitrophota bacterium]